MSTLIIIAICAHAMQDDGLQRLIDRGLPELPRGMSIAWEVEHHAGMTASEIASLKNRIAGKPDHPERARLANAVRRASSGPDVVRYEALIDSSGRLRLAEITTGSTTDTIITDNLVWVLAGDSLTLLDARRDPPPGRNFRPTKDVARRHVGGFRHGALSILIGVPDPRLLRYRAEGPSWSATVGMRDDLGTIEVDGTLSAGEWFARQARITRLNPAPSDVGARVTASEPWADSPIGPVFRVIESYSPSGSLTYRNRLLSITPWPGDDAVFRPPAREGGSDAIRGPLTLSSVADFRSDPSGDFWNRPSPGKPLTAIAPPPGDPTRTMLTLDRAGYAIAGGIALIVVGVWARRRWM